MLASAVRDGFRFHLEHGGYCTPPGRAACALGAARAELLLRERMAEGNARVVWEYDEGGADVIGDADYAALTAGAVEGPFVCAIEIQGETVAALGGIVLSQEGFGSFGALPDQSFGWSPDPYARVVEAELAVEAREALAGPVAGRGGLRGVLANV